MTLRSIFKIVAFLEGLSYILLLFIAVPVKYLLGDPGFVKMLGMPHGILFILYIIIAIMLGVKLKLNNRKIIWLLAASIIPFATFYVDKRILKSTTV